MSKKYYKGLSEIAQSFRMDDRGEMIKAGWERINNLINPNKNALGNID